MNQLSQSMKIAEIVSALRFLHELAHLPNESKIKQAAVGVAAQALANTPAKFVELANEIEMTTEIEIYNKANAL